jgi:hypothetical protein
MVSHDAGGSWTEIAADIQLNQPAVLHTSAEGAIYFLESQGIYRSRDQGKTWSLTPRPPMLGFGNIMALDPGSPGVIYLDGISLEPGSTPMGMLARSTDDGQSWTRCGTFAEQAQKIWVDAANRDNVWVLTQTEIYRSTDSCSTFEKRSQGLPGRSLSDASQDRNNASNIWVTAYPAGDLVLTKLTADGTSAIFSTYLGTRQEELAGGMALGPNGEIWIAGTTYSGQWPVTEGAFQSTKQPNWREDPFVTRLSPEGDRIVASTYVAGLHSEGALAIRATPEGDVWVAGLTQSPNFPLQDPIQDRLLGQADGFLFRLSEDATTLRFSTLLGGSGIDWILALALDPDGNVWATGRTSSKDLPVSPRAFQPEHKGSGSDDDAFVIRVSAPVNQVQN